MILYRLLLDPEAGDGGGLDEVPENPAEKLKGLLEKSNGDAAALATKLFDENYKLRAKRREERTKYESTLKDYESKIPKEGVKLLTDDDAKLIESYRQLGDPDSLKQLKEQYEELSSWKTQVERDSLVSKAAGLHGFKPSVLKTIANGLEIEIREVGSGSAAREQAYVKDGDKESRLDQYVEKHFKDFLPSLKAGDGGISSSTRNASNGQAIGQDDRVAKALAVFSRL